MEDIKFHKFVCYILNCISKNKTFIYQDGDYKQVDYEDVTIGGSTFKRSKESFKDLNNNAIYAGTDAKVVDATIKNYIEYFKNNREYFNIQQVPLYITSSTDDKILDIKKSIYQIFNILKTSFDAKKWYIDSNFTPNKPSPQTFQLTSKFIGGALTDYEQFLQLVIKDFILLLNNTVDGPTDIKMYVLSKINYYIAKEYVKLVFNSITKSEDKTEANKPYEKSTLTGFKIYNKEYEDKHYPQYYQKEILDTMNIYVDKTDDEDEAKKLFNTDVKAVVKLFNTIKPFLKKQPTVFYQTPITTYTYNPTNIRPLIYRRASEYDLSNFATQIASDAFLNKNKLPVIYDFEKVMEPVTKASATGAVGGCSDVNNSSNVYRTIYVKILNILNAKRITLNGTDKEAIETKLNELEQTENYLKERLGDYAKYVSATQDKDKTIQYSDVQKFLNEYEDKIKKYNSDSAKIVRFISRLTPYLY